MLAVYFATEAGFLKRVICDGVFHAVKVPLDELPRFRNVVRSSRFPGGLGEVVTALLQFRLPLDGGSSQESCYFADRGPQRLDLQVLENAMADGERLPLPLSAARIAFTVMALGTLTSNGSAFSAATRTGNMRTAPDSAMPIPARVFAALCLVFSSTRR